MIAAQQASQLCEAMLASPTTPKDDSSIDIIMRATPLMLAGSTISRRERYAGGPMAPGDGCWFVRRHQFKAYSEATQSHLGAHLDCREKAALIKNAGGKVRWPETVGELMEIKAGFQAVHGLPNCCGAIDATHINIHLPKNETNESWYDRYGNYSMLVQGIVDANLRFLDVNIGWTGSCNDKHVLQNSGFYRLC
ncbi:hypothetical protein L7F22_061031 [Adiantum nelumboides]|nr:hypothetical protein [Adiantum nelumboides]